MKILVIEDEHRIATSIKKGLELETYTVDVCFSGALGYDLAASESYDVIILDLMLPDMDGVSVCIKLRDQHIHTPILMLTAKGQLHEKVHGLNSGADDYLTKPFAFEELLARVRALGRRPKKAEAMILKAGTLSMDRTAYIVKRSGAQIHLSSKEFALLEYMLRHKGTTLTKDHIISHVWDVDADILPNTVEVYIKNLRNKIDTPFPNEQPLIQTIRGFGYKFSM